MSKRILSLGPLAARRFLATTTPDISLSHRYPAVKLNRRVVNAEYAVRGRLAIRAEELRNQLVDKPGSLPFEEVISLNIGNPQQLDQHPITFYRQVLALLQYPDLMKDPDTAKKFPPDVIERASTLLKHIGSVGAYSHSKGVPYIRQRVAKFLERRDGFPADPENIFLTAGASAGVSNLLDVLTYSRKTAYLIPIPQYPLYSATLSLVDSTPIQYYLDESRGWTANTNEIENLIFDAKDDDLHIAAMVVINPGNPTGSVLSREDMVKIIDLAARYNFLIIADEVYQENVYQGQFLSFKKVLRELQENSPKKYGHVMLASLHSASKGMIGECGQRGGYMELVGFPNVIRENVLKLASISLCSVVSGQALVELMLNPPVPGEASYEQFHKEKSGIFNTLVERSTLLYNAFQQMEGVSCQKPAGAMYLFPKINLPRKLCETAKAAGMEPDEFYCLQLLEGTGICIIPGSGFGQEEGTFHFRTTFLAPGSEYANRLVKFHNDLYQKYADDQTSN